MNSIIKLFNFKKGETVLLNGKMAEEYFRWIGNNDGTGGEEGDLGRIKNQQNFIKKVIEKCLKPSIIFKIPKLLDIIKTIFQLICFIKIY